MWLLDIDMVNHTQVDIKIIYVETQRSLPKILFSTENFKIVIQLHILFAINTKRLSKNYEHDLYGLIVLC